MLLSFGSLALDAVYWVESAEKLVPHSRRLHRHYRTAVFKRETPKGRGIGVGGGMTTINPWQPGPVTTVTVSLLSLVTGVLFQS